MPPLSLGSPPTVIYYQTTRGVPGMLSEMTAAGSREFAAGTVSGLCFGKLWNEDRGPCGSTCLQIGLRSRRLLQRIALIDLDPDDSGADYIEQFPGRSQQIRALRGIGHQGR